MVDARPAMKRFEIKIYYSATGFHKKYKTFKFKRKKNLRQVYNSLKIFLYVFGKVKIFAYMNNRIYDLQTPRKLGLFYIFTSSPNVL